MHGHGMAQVCLELKNRGVDLRSMSAIELFAGTGAYATNVLYGSVAKIEAWERDYDKAKLLMSNCPRAKVVISDSIMEIGRLAEDHGGERFDVVSMDNPMGEFGPRGDSTRYCEHFESIYLVNRLLKICGGVVIFDLNIDPYDMHKHAGWKLQREAFYGDFVEQGNDRRSRLYSNVLQHYHSFFAAMRWRVKEAFVVARDHSIHRHKNWLRFACFVLGRSRHGKC